MVFWEEMIVHTHTHLSPSMKQFRTMCSDNTLSKTVHIITTFTFRSWDLLGNIILSCTAHWLAAEKRVCERRPYAAVLIAKQTSNADPLIHMLVSMSVRLQYQGVSSSAAQHSETEGGLQPESVQWGGAGPGHPEHSDPPVPSVWEWGQQYLTGHAAPVGLLPSTPWARSGLSLHQEER